MAGLALEKTENDNGVQSTIKIFRKGKMVVGEGEYIKDGKMCNCEVSILLGDLGYSAYITRDFDDEVIYITDFMCSESKKGYGKTLLFEVLEYIRREKGPNTIVTLVAVSKERIVDGENILQDTKRLMAYYTRLGFTRIPEVSGAMYGNIEAIMKMCSPDKFKSLRARSRSPEPEETKEEQTAAPTRPAATAADFSDGSIAPLGSEFDSTSVGSSVGSVYAHSNSVSSTSVERPPKGGKKNHTNRKYRIKTIKNKNKKSKKRWSFKYKKSINCKRPRGFSQRQYCKYGRKNLKAT